MNNRRLDGAKGVRSFSQLFLNTESRKDENTKTKARNDEVCSLRKVPPIRATDHTHEIQCVPELQNTPTALRKVQIQILEFQQYKNSYRG